MRGDARRKVRVMCGDLWPAVWQIASPADGCEIERDYAKILYIILVGPRARGWRFDLRMVDLMARG